MADGTRKNYGGDAWPWLLERDDWCLPLVRLGRHRELEDVSGSPRTGAPSGVWAGGQLVLKLEEPGREKRVSSRSRKDRLAKSWASWRTCVSAIACEVGGGYIGPWAGDSGQTSWRRRYRCSV